MTSAAHATDFGRLAPTAGEAAVLSVLATKSDTEDWEVVSASLLTMPQPWTAQSWRQWHFRQPHPKRTWPEGIDLGPVFDTEPFPGVRVIRAVVPPAGWFDVVTHLLAGQLLTATAVLSVHLGAWSPEVMLFQGGVTDPERVVASAHRPVLGSFAATKHNAVPHSDAVWAWTLPPHTPRGRDLGEMYRARTLLHWPRELAGIDWLGTDEYPPPACFVIGRLLDTAWLVEVRIKTREDELAVTMGWNADKIDPFSLTLAVRSSFGEHRMVDRQVKVGDLPPRPAPPHALTAADFTTPRGVIAEPRTMAWNQRSMTVRVARTPPRTRWGVALIGPDGQLLDERPVAQRFEGTFQFSYGDEPLPVDVPPTREEQNQAAALAAQVESDARSAASKRRVSTAADLGDYLRWRFSARRGELLLIDYHLLGGVATQTVSYLRTLDRPIRALTKVSPKTSAHSDDVIKFRGLPSDVNVHDRLWLVGDTALLVGGSVNTFVGTGLATTTVAELPHADSLNWRATFESWWARAPP